jgi:biotin operon repressor
MSTPKKRGGYRKAHFLDLSRKEPKWAADLLETTWNGTQSATKAATALGISRRSFFRCVTHLESLGYTVRRPYAE